MVRLDDDLYTRIFETAHDQRQSMNQYVIQALREHMQANMSTN